MSKKKWVTILEDAEVRWLSGMVKETGVSGSSILSELVRREMAQKGSALRDELRSVKLKLQLQRLNDEKVRLATKEQELMKQLKGERVAVTA